MPVRRRHGIPRLALVAAGRTGGFSILVSHLFQKCCKSLPAVLAQNINRRFVPHVWPQIDIFTPASCALEYRKHFIFDATSTLVNPRLSTTLVVFAGEEQTSAK